MPLIQKDVTLQVKNNRKRTKGRKYSIVKRKNGQTVKLFNVKVYTRIDN